MAIANPGKIAIIAPEIVRLQRIRHVPWERLKQPSLAAIALSEAFFLGHADMNPLRASMWEAIGGWHRSTIAAVAPCHHLHHGVDRRLKCDKPSMMGIW